VHDAKTLLLQPGDVQCTCTKPWTACVASTVQHYLTQPQMPYVGMCMMHALFVPAAWQHQPDCSSNDSSQPTLACMLQVWSFPAGRVLHVAAGDLHALTSDGRLLATSDGYRQVQVCALGMQLAQYRFACCLELAHGMDTVCCTPMVIYLAPCLTQCLSAPICCIIRVCCCNLAALLNFFVTHWLLGALLQSCKSASYHRQCVHARIHAGKLVSSSSAAAAAATITEQALDVMEQSAS
jgi:hypothetical protein